MGFSKIPNFVRVDTLQNSNIQFMFLHCEGIFTNVVTGARSRDSMAQGFRRLTLHLRGRAASMRVWRPEGLGIESRRFIFFFL